MTDPFKKYKHQDIYISIILPVFHGCETWSHILWEEHKLRVFENRVLRNICAPKREELTGDWRRVYIEELHGLYSSPLYDQIKEKERGGARRTHGK
jgi:hypothetical protein